MDISLLFGITAATVLFIQTRCATDHEDSMPHYLVPSQTQCYLQYSTPIASLVSNQNNLLEATQKYPICLCEKIINKQLILEKFPSAETSCTSTVTISKCNTTERNQCMQTIWMGSTDNIPSDSKYLNMRDPILLGCDIDLNNGAATMAVEIERIGALDIGNRCDKQKIVEFLNDGIERHRIGSHYYYRIMVSHGQLGQFCDPELFLEGTAMQIHFRCLQAKPHSPKIVKNCMEACKKLKQCMDQQKCPVCDFQSDLNKIEVSFKNCMERSGYYIYWTQNTKSDTSCGIDPSNNFPWAVGFDMHPKNPLWTTPSQYVVEWKRRGGFPVKVIRNSNFALGMGTLIDQQTILTVKHNTDGIVAGSHVGIVSGGSTHRGSNLWDERYTFATDVIQYIPSSNSDSTLIVSL